MSGKKKYVCSLSNRSELKAERELHETPEIRTMALERLQKAVKDYPGLFCPTDTVFLLQFLRARKFDEHRTMKLILQHYRRKNASPEIFTKFRPSVTRHILDLGIINILPYRDDEGRTVCWIRLGLWDHDTCDLDGTFKAILICAQRCLEEEETQVNGFCIILDFENFGMCKALHIIPPMVRKIYELLQDGMPARVKAIHYINEPIVIGYLFPIMKPIMKDKIIKRIFIHSPGYEDLYRYFTPSILPSSLGGTMTDWEQRRQGWLRRLYASEERYIQMEKYKLVEKDSRKTGNNVNQNDPT